MAKTPLYESTIATKARKIARVVQTPFRQEAEKMVTEMLVAAREMAFLKSHVRYQDSRLYLDGGSYKNLFDKFAGYVESYACSFSSPQESIEALRRLHAHKEIIGTGGFGLSILTSQLGGIDGLEGRLQQIKAESSREFTERAKLSEAVGKSVDSNTQGSESKGSSRYINNPQSKSLPRGQLSELEGRRY